MLNILPQEISTKKVVGELDGSPVYQLGLKGGLFILAKVKGAQLELIGSGPHHLVAKAVAKKMHPNLVITELLKSEGITEQHYARIVPYYVDLTNKLNSALNG